MSTTRAHVLFTGRVQGVFFRAFTEQAASMHGLTGWVRNMPGGQVEAVFEGEKDKIEAAINICKTGNPSARVDDVDINWSNPTGEFRSFQIEYY